MWKWSEHREILETLINEGVSYEDIGRKFGCTGANIKKQAKKLGIVLPKRREVKDCETFNKGVKRKTCVVCGKPISRGNVCSRSCSKKKKDLEKVERWLNGENFQRGATQVPRFIRDYLFNIHKCQCEKCGWGKVNPVTGKSPLEVHHIDGDCTNNRYDNLELLCPNCHSLTENNGSLNKNSKRFHRKKKTLKDE